MGVIIPRSFEEWQNCIVHDCGIDLSKSFAKERLAVFENENHPETKNFKKLYGEKHLDNIIYWYKIVLK